MERNEQSAHYNNKALILSRKVEYRKGEADAYELRGILYRNNGFYEEAAVDQLTSLEINRSIDNYKGLGSGFGNMGMIYLEEGNYKKAKENFLQSLAHKRALEKVDTVSIIFTLLDLTQSYIGSVMYDSATIYCDSALILGNAIRHSGSIETARYNSALINFHKYENDSALFELNEVDSSCDKSGNWYIKIKSNYLISEIFRLRGEFERAIRYGNISLDLSKKYKLIKDIKKALYGISKSYAGLKDYKNAYTYQSQYTSYKDSIQNKESEQKTILLASKYEFETQQKILETEYSNKIEKQKLILAISGLLILIFIFTFILLVTKNKKLKSANRNIEKANEEIESRNKEIHQQKEKIHQQAEKLIHINASKDKVFNIISHDLREPIESLRILLDLTNSDELTHDDFKNLSHSLKNKVDALSDTLNNLLIWSRNQMGGFSISTSVFDLKMVIDKHLELFQEPANNKQIQLLSNIRDSIKVLADEGHIRLVLRNLINNALKFTPKGGRIIINAVKDKDFFHISIRDNGIGIDSSDLHKLFNPDMLFTKSGTEGEKGTGIGLMLCKEIIEKNDGEIFVESELGKGTVFTIKIPNADIPKLLEVN